MLANDDCLDVKVLLASMDVLAASLRPDRLRRR